MIQIAMMAAMLFTLYFALKKVGLIDPLIKNKVQREKEKIEIEQNKEFQERWSEILNADKFILNYYGFDPEYFKTTSENRITPESEVIKLAKKLDNSFGFINDDEEMIYSVFRQLENASQLSQVSNAYFGLNGYYLNDTLIEYLNNDELAIIVEIVKRWK